MFPLESIQDKGEDSINLYPAEMQESKLSTRLFFSVIYLAILYDAKAPADEIIRTIIMRAINLIIKK